MVMALTPEQEERVEKLRYWQLHLAPIAAILGITYGLVRLWPLIKKKLK